MACSVSMQVAIVVRATYFDPYEVLVSRDKVSVFVLVEDNTHP
jgi:hypothetical protein